MAATDPKIVKQPPSNNPWTTRELSELRRWAHLGAEVAAQLLERSVASVRYAAHRHRISLRQPGSRDGLVLGQPRGVSFLDMRDDAILADALGALRDDLLEGKLDPRDLDRSLRRQILIATGAELCPACSTNPQEVETSGFCTDCHLRALAQAHRDADHTSRAQQELWRERQRKVRRGRRVPPDERDPDD